MKKMKENCRLNNKKLVYTKTNKSEKIKSEKKKKKQTWKCSFTRTYVVLAKKLNVRHV